MKKLLVLFLGLLLMASFISGCSEKDDNTTGPDQNGEPPALATTPDEVMAVPDSASLVNYTFETVTYNDLDMPGYPLTQFIQFAKEFDETLEYTYEIVSDDGYSPRDGQNADLCWADVSTGYLLPETKHRTFFPSDDIFSAYDVKYADHINLYRTVKVIIATKEVYFQTGAIETEDVLHQAGNGEYYTDSGFKLENLISEYVTENPADHNFTFIASDNYDKTYTWAELQTGYWLTERNKAVFLNPDGTEISSSFKHLISIELAE